MRHTLASLAVVAVALLMAVAVRADDPVTTPDPAPAVAVAPAPTSPTVAPPDPLQVRNATAAGLKWLADQQLTDGPEAGSWAAPRPEYRPAVAGLAGLAFLANGYLPDDPQYGPVVRRAMRYVMSTATPDGYVGQGDKSGMYIHAICTLFGLSYLGMSDDPAQDPELAAWCRRSLTVILDAQMVRRSGGARGGWRYTPDTTESDVSVTSWQLLALHAARQCGYPIDRGVVDGALKYVNSAWRETPDGAAGFLYRPDVSTQVEPAATGVALFIKRLLEPRPDERTARALAYLDTFPPSWGGRQYGNFFYFASFYLAQGMFQIGGDTWTNYRDRLQSLLLEHQSGDGSWPFPTDEAPQSRLAGPAFPTAMAVLLLSLDQQYLPMYQRQSRLY